MEIVSRALQPVIEEVVVRADPRGFLAQTLDGRASPLSGIEEREGARRRVRLQVGGDDQRELEAIAGPQRQMIIGAGGIETVGRRIEHERRRAAQAVEAAVAQAHHTRVALARQHLAALRTRMTADLEDVDEVGGERQRQREVVTFLDERLDGQPMIELRTEDRQPARQPHRASRQHEVRLQRHIGVGEVDRGLQRVVGHAGVQRDAAQAVQPQLEQREEARVTDVEAEFARHVREVAAPIRHQERVVVLEHELGQVGGDAGGEDVVVLADEDVVSG